MRADRVALEDFRNYLRAQTELAPGLNLVVGRNGHGKTNLLEAVYCLSGLGSPRGSDVVLVRDGAERAFLHGDVVRAQRQVRVDLEIRPGRGSRALINKTAAGSARALSEIIVSVFFGPDELALIKGSPDGRRRFLDDLVVKMRPARYGLRREWERVLKQRNALLRSAPRRSSPSVASTLEVWDESFCRSGAALGAARLEVLTELLPYASKRYEAIAGGGSLSLGYASAWVKDDYARAILDRAEPVDEARLRGALEDAMEEVRARELERGTSLVGPQRDDISVLLATPSTPGPLDARSFASQGEQRTGALGLKLGEFDLLRAALDEAPILLLDDVFSELDPQRREWLADTVRGAGQTLLSSAEPGAVEAAGAENVIEVTRGELRTRG